MEKRSLKIKAFFKENIFIIGCIAFVVLFQTYYINTATANVPIMDYWIFINQITEKVFTGTLTWADFWVASAGSHINPFLYLMLVINMKVFGLNTRIEIFSGIFVMLATTLLLYAVYYRTMIKKLGYHKKLSQVLYLTIVFAVFNFNQWEILTLQFSFISMSRIFAFISIFVFLDNLLKNFKKSKKKIVLLGIFIAVVICTLSAGYFPSMVGAVIFTLFLHLFLHRKEDGLKYMQEYLLLLVFIGIGSILYLTGVTLSSSGGDARSFIAAIYNGNLVKGILIMLGGSIIPAELSAKYAGIHFYYPVGIIILVLYTGAIILFFTKKMWKYNYLPMTLITYTISNIILIFYARASVFNLEYLASSRYVCETTLGLIGVLWILIDALLGEVKQGEAKKYIKAGNSLGILFIFIFLVNSVVVETHTAPYRKINHEKAIGIMINIESVDDESLGIFQAGNPQYVRNGVALMKKYHLGIFHSDYQFNEYAHLIKKEIDTSFESVEWVNGKYDDGWLDKSCEFKIKTGAKGKLVFKGYYPNEITGNETGSIYVNDKETPYTISENNFTIKVNAPIQSTVKVNIESNFSFIAKPPDIRKLTFILIDVQGE